MSASDANSIDWVKLIGGGFAHTTASFAVHPLDRDRAKKYLRQAKAHGLTVSDALAHAKEHLNTATGWPTNEAVQLQRVEKFFAGKLPRS